MIRIFRKDRKRTEHPEMAAPAAIPPHRTFSVECASSPFTPYSLVAREAELCLPIEVVDIDGFSVRP